MPTDDVRSLVADEDAPRRPRFVMPLRLSTLRLTWQLFGSELLARSVLALVNPREAIADLHRCAIVLANLGLVEMKEREKRRRGRTR